MITYVCFIRHGETVWNKEERFQGQMDIPLSEAGVEQAKCLADYLKDQSISVIYSSDLKRARQTAELIAAKRGLTVQATPELRERSAGEWEGLTLSEIKEKYPDWEKVRLVGGVYGIEPIEELKKRMLGKVEALVEKHQGEHIYIVAHGMCINAVLHVLTDGEYGTGKTRLHNTSMTQLSYENEAGWKLLKINETPHLTPKKEIYS
jgi:broad specificity phosphatase PhoE